ncbi:pyrroline-5-carboxylate reductase [Syntrophus aciditrophicus]|uniref:Pyrroline-5-carboxylate reductase n=1 Tax=Syntrophus aciditrophicus (strain SB) TaxID=56780 RepID=Q2LU57_SYNAS|nr:pyrroline-5-carboxylate reductase [Syntrophus aciditrophicus]ABC77615.1 pyrroline-5-carboxylate reductase [Syntrophus aciditrophicus SB]OPY16004.1 MAG: Pyrroline-5-carboxylate reductase [Syntrophus sp. PtaB.Bin075]
MFENQKIGLVGCGKMGTILLSGMLRNRLVAESQIRVADVVKERLEEIHEAYPDIVQESNQPLARSVDILILAVKPQNLPELLNELTEDIHSGQLIVSVAAGISTRLIEKHLSGPVRVVRAMPNTPALVGEGVTALAAGAYATQKDVETVARLFEAVGLTVKINENLMDAVTGLSGSGPGYVFVILEALADAGVFLGLPRETALKLAAQTLLGSAKLYLRTGKHPGELKDMVTSPGGTTIAGLKALEEGRLRATLMTAVEAATRRSKVLAGDE